MAKDRDMERRMLNWVRWREGSCSIGLGYGSASIWHGVRVDGQRCSQSVIPTDAFEAEQTDQAVAALPAYLSATVEVYYLSDTTMEHKAKVLGCGVSTVHARIADAHRKIVAWFSDRQRVDAEHRQRQESIQRLAREVRMGAALAIELPPSSTRSKRVRQK